MPEYALINRLGAIVVAGVMIALLLGVLKYLRTTPPHLLRWAQGLGFEILHFEQRSLFLGPHRWKSCSGKTVYFVKGRDREGRERACWILVSDEKYQDIEVDEVIWVEL